jgi:hypothetical protein
LVRRRPGLSASRTRGSAAGGAKEALLGRTGEQAVGEPAEATNPWPSGGRPSAYFPSIRPRKASAARRSDSLLENRMTVTRGRPPGGDDGSAPAPCAAPQGRGIRSRFGLNTGFSSRPGAGAAPNVPGPVAVGTAAMRSDFRVAMFKMR